MLIKYNNYGRAMFAINFTTFNFEIQINTDKYRNLQISADKVNNEYR